MAMVSDMFSLNDECVHASLCCIADSSLDAMGVAVQQADVVLVCFSQKYKDNPYFRTG